MWLRKLSKTDIRHLTNNFPLLMKMKKVLLSILAAITVVMSAKAQDYLLDNPDNRAHFGVRLGLDVTSLVGNGDRYGTKSGFNLTGIYNLPIWKNLYFEPGIGVFYDTASINAVYSTDDVQILERGSVRNFGFRIPFNFGYRFDVTDDVSVHLFTGPQLNYNITFGTYYNGAKATNQPEADFNRFDFQWNIGLGVDYRNYYAYIEGDFGMSRLIQEKKFSYNEHQLAFPGAKRNIFSIGIGYNF